MVVAASYSFSAAGPGGFVKRKINAEKLNGDPGEQFLSICKRTPVLFSSKTTTPKHQAKVTNKWFEDKKGIFSSGPAETQSSVQWRIWGRT